MTQADQDVRRLIDALRRAFGDAQTHLRAAGFYMIGVGLPGAGPVVPYDLR